MSVEQLAKPTSSLPLEGRCWAKALICPCVTKSTVPRVLDIEKIFERVVNNAPVMNSYNTPCDHSCSNFAQEPLGLCGFHRGWYGMDVFGE